MEEFVALRELRFGPAERGESRPVVLLCQVTLSDPVLCVVLERMRPGTIQNTFESDDRSLVFSAPVIL